MSTKRKVSLTGVFLVGLMSLAASIARMAIYLIVLYDGYSAGYDIDRELGQQSTRCLVTCVNRTNRHGNDYAIVEYARGISCIHSYKSSST